ncbi:ArdC family protein [Paenibacillus kribbensis]|uniref:ArdC family protein n=1 Tax=Paenibacillus kribbensis TaxID=172713 RepID=UPI0008389634|nr:ArdC family protein [Paenibacillus kribbensis]
MPFPKTQDYEKKMAQVQKQVDQAIQRVFQSNEFQRYLEVAAKFPKYSMNNIVMIYSQNPDATMVQGYKAWKELDRQVQAGEKAIKIFAPTFRKVEMTKIDPVTQRPQLDAQGKEITEKKEMLTGFTAVNVFDVSQTKGKELVNIRDIVRDDIRDSAKALNMYRSFSAHLSQKMDVRESAEDFKQHPNVRGFYDRENHAIRINPNVGNSTMQLKTLIHEYAHSQIHRMDSPLKDLPKGHKEAQAEATAFMVTKYYGLDTEAYSAGYIATWAKDIKLAKQALTEIQKVANNIIREMDHVNKERIQEIVNTKPLNKEEERSAFLQDAQIAAVRIGKEFTANPAAFRNEKVEDVKMLLDYAEKMERNEKIPEPMKERYDKIRAEIFEDYDKPEVAESKRAILVDYIERYEKAVHHGEPTPAADREDTSTDRAEKNEKSNVVQFPKSKSGPELER